MHLSPTLTKDSTTENIIRACKFATVPKRRTKAFFPEPSPNKSVKRVDAFPFNRSQIDTTITNADYLDGLFGISTTAKTRQFTSSFGFARAVNAAGEEM
uniref:Uncharacterized protein n=1 Tax=Physcomitrium patens TaxID=3218 RepID=A0A2K1IBG5_PHYPA|nr:hypothetical protein PHYPA_030099 [Physcomitrium patens]